VPLSVLIDDLEPGVWEVSAHIRAKKLRASA